MVLSQNNMKQYWGIPEEFLNTKNIKESQETVQYCLQWEGGIEIENLI